MLRILSIFLVIFSPMVYAFCENGDIYIQNNSGTTLTVLLTGNTGANGKACDTTMNTGANNIKGVCDVLVLNSGEKTKYTYTYHPQASDWHVIAVPVATEDMVTIFSDFRIVKAWKDFYVGTGAILSSDAKPDSDGQPPIDSDKYPGCDVKFDTCSESPRYLTWTGPITVEAWDTTGGGVYQPHCPYSTSKF